LRRGARPDRRRHDGCGGGAATAIDGAPARVERLAADQQRTHAEQVALACAHDGGAIDAGRACRARAVAITRALYGAAPTLHASRVVPVLLDAPSIDACAVPRDLVAVDAADADATARDLIAWQKALEGGRVVTAASYRQMITAQPLADGTPTGYGFGLIPADFAGHRVIGHSGGVSGFSAYALYFPDDDLRVVALTNTRDGDPPAFAAARQLLRIPDATPLPVPPADVPRYARTVSLGSKQAKLVVEGTNLAVGLGLAALGRPGYITLGHGEDLAGAYEPAAMEARCHAVLDAAWAAGVRWFDAARSYGRAEAWLASWLAARGVAPGEATLSSKWGYTYTAAWGVAADVVLSGAVTVEQLASNARALACDGAELTSLTESPERYWSARSKLPWN
jgi:hypothetical protein